MNSFLLIHNNIPNIDIIQQSSKVEYKNYNTIHNSSDIINIIIDIFSKNDNIENIGLLWENNFIQNSFFSDNSDKYFNNIFDIFIGTLCSYKQNRLFIIDLITCNINTEEQINHLHYLENNYNVMFRYSLDETGNYLQGDWVLESHNIDIKNIYFNDNIYNYQDILGSFSADGMIYIIDNSGDVYGAGRNMLGELGINSTSTNFTSLQKMHDISNAMKVSSGNYNCFIVTDDNKGYSCGNNSQRILGINSSTSRIYTPQPMLDTDGISHLSNIIDIAPNMYNVFVLKSNGYLYAYGKNSSDSILGIGPNGATSYTTLQHCKYENSFVTNCKKVFACGYHTFIIDNSGYAWVCGRDKYSTNTTQTGKLATGTFDDYTYFTPVIDSSDNHLNNVKQIDGTYRYSIFLKNDGTMYYAGTLNASLNASVNLFDGNTYNKATLLTDISNVASITTANQHILALLNDGTVLSRGRNNNRQLGDGTTSHRDTFVNVKYPDNSTDISNVLLVIGGGIQSYIYTSNNDFISFGRNNHGQLGRGLNIADSNNPYDGNPVSFDLKIRNMTKSDFYEPISDDLSTFLNSYNINNDIYNISINNNGESIDFNYLSSYINSTNDSLRSSLRLNTLKVIFAKNKHISYFKTNVNNLLLNDRNTNDNTNVYVFNNNTTTNISSFDLNNVSLYYNLNDNDEFIQLNTDSKIIIVSKSNGKYIVNITNNDNTNSSLGPYDLNDEITVDSCKFIFGGLLITSGSSTSSSTSGDPHIFPVIGKSYELPNKIANYRMIQGENFILNASTRKLSNYEKSEIKQYFISFMKKSNNHFNNHILNKLTVNGVVYDLMYLYVDNNILLINFDEFCVFGNNYFTIKRVKRHNKQIKYSYEILFNHSIYNTCKIYINFFYNPQEKYGIDFECDNIIDLQGLLIREYNTQHFELDNLYSKHFIHIKNNKSYNTSYNTSYNKIISFYNN